jgi:hypothetical protein
VIVLIVGVTGYGKSIMYICIIVLVLIVLLGIVDIVFYFLDMGSSITDTKGLIFYIIWEVVLMALLAYLIYKKYKESKSGKGSVGGMLQKAKDMMNQGGTAGGMNTSNMMKKAQEMMQGNGNSIQNILKSLNVPNASMYGKKGDDGGENDEGNDGGDDGGNDDNDEGGEPSTTRLDTLYQDPIQRYATYAMQPPATYPPMAYPPMQPTMMPVPMTTMPMMQPTMVQSFPMQQQYIPPPGYPNMYNTSR